MKIINVDQGTQEWYASRMCKVTGTKLKSVMGTAEARRTLIAELIAEKATEQAKAMITTAELERGKGEEVFAIKEFEKKTGKTVDRIGMCIHDEYDWLALSPDGMIQVPGLDHLNQYSEAIEVKCPDSKKAILYKIENLIPMEETGLVGSKGVALAGAPFLGIPAEYKWQAVHYFIVNERLQKLNFAVYDARFINDESKLYIVELSRDNEILQDTIKQAMEELMKFRETWLRWEEIVLPNTF